ncbi:hypothetical protein [Pseudomonas sp.]|uniref:hypothetical protein n=1 Tax=Pseudomonas sp. TaxID=306 RepID=UPI0027329B0A|nr:hypothetical protein [Pseudomonas sp.]MDP2745621.1 hypothetical protein [Pseudomonas sp.]
MKAQRGQSMTEYLVVLGVTGAALMLAGNDVERLFDNVRSSYKTYSSEMNKVQLYNNEAVRFLDPSPDDDFDDGQPESPPPSDTEQPASDALAVLNEVYDANGMYVGRVVNDQLVAANGDVIGTYALDASGNSILLDANGQVLYPGFSISQVFVDSTGKPLVLQALANANGEVLGFAYLERNKYYNAVTGKALVKQPQGLTPIATRDVLMYAPDGKTFVAAYEAAGLVYAKSDALISSSGTFTSPRKITGELVSLYLAPETEAAWSKHSLCIVRSYGWAAEQVSPLPAEGASVAIGSSVYGQFNAPEAQLSYVDSTADACKARFSVLQTKVPNSATQWSLRRN